MNKEDVVPGKLYINIHLGSIWIAIRETDIKGDRVDAVCVYKGNEGSCVYGKYELVHWNNLELFEGILPLTKGLPRLMIWTGKFSKIVVLFIEHKKGVILEHRDRPTGSLSETVAIDQTTTTGLRYWKELK